MANYDYTKIKGVLELDIHEFLIWISEDSDRAELEANLRRKK